MRTATDLFFCDKSANLKHPNVGTSMVIIALDIVIIYFTVRTVTKLNLPPLRPLLVPSSLCTTTVPPVVQPKVAPLIPPLVPPPVPVQFKVCACWTL